MPPAELDPRAFLDAGSEGAQLLAPDRTAGSIQLATVRHPASANFRHRKQHRSQAVVVEPPMLCVAARAGFCFSFEGAPFSIRDVQGAARRIFRGHVEPLEGLTTYSFRRILPTVGRMLQFTDDERWTKTGRRPLCR